MNTRWFLSSLIFIFPLFSQSSTWIGNNTHNLWFPEPKVDLTNNWLPPNVPGAPGNADIEAIFPTPNVTTNGVLINNINGKEPLLNTIQINDTYLMSYFAGTITLGGGTLTPSITVAPGKTLYLVSGTPLNVFSSIGSATLNGNFSLGGGLFAQSSFFIPSGSVVNVNGSTSVIVPTLREYASAQIVQDSSLPPTPTIIEGELKLENSGSPGYIHGSNTFVFLNHTNAQLNVSDSLLINDQATLQVNAGTLTVSNLFIVDRSNVVINDGTLSILKSQFTNSLLDILGGTVDLGIVNTTFTNSKIHVANSASLVDFGINLNNSTFTVDHGGLDIFTNTNFNHSTLNIGEGDLTGQVASFNNQSSINLTQGNFAADSGFSFTDSSVNITQGNFSPNNSVYFTITHAYNQSTYINIGIGDAILNQPQIVQFNADSSVQSGDTYTLFVIDQGFIHNPHNIQYPTSSSLIWQPTLSTNPSGQINTITITAHQSHPSPTATLASLTSNQTLTTLQRSENMRENRMRGFATEHLVATHHFQNDSYLVQNDMIAQQTPVELLGDRAIERPYYPWSFYIAPTGSFGTSKTRNGQCGCNFYTAGFMTGFDWATSYTCNPCQNYAFGIGTTFYYNHFHTKVDDRGGKTDIDQIYAKIYGTWISRDLEELSVNFGAGAGYDWHHQRRATGDFGTLVASSNPGGYEAGGFFELEYLLSRAQFPRLGYFRFIPIAMLEYTWLSINDYTEHGAGIFNLRVNSDSFNSLRSFLGARMNYLFRANCNVTIRPEVTLGWQREYLNTSQRFNFSNYTALNPQTATLFTITPDRNTFIAGADIYVRIYEQHSLLLNYQMNLNDLIFTNSFYLEWKVEF